MGLITKEYNKLTLEQFKRLITMLPELRREKAEMDLALKGASKEKLDQLLGSGLAWAPVYEAPLHVHMAILVVAFNKHTLLRDAVQSSDPQQMLFDEFEKDWPDDWDGGFLGLFDKQTVIALAYSLQRTIQSIMIYQRSLSALVEEVRGGSDKALFDAVRIDRSIVACPTIADRIAKAELLGDKSFFQHLRNALKGLSGRHWQGYQDLRYSLALLREMGMDALSDEQLEHLLVDQLKVYPSTFNARRNLRKQYAESKKFKHLI